MTYSQTEIANASMPSYFESVDVSAVDYSVSTATDQQEFQIFVGVGGDVAVDGAKGGVDVVFKNVPDGSWLPGRFIRIDSGLTTATNIVIGKYAE